MSYPAEERIKGLSSTIVDSEGRANSASFTNKAVLNSSISEVQ